MVSGIKRITKIKIEHGHAREVCDFCLEKGKVYRLRSAYRNYRFLNVCPKCLNAIRGAFKEIF